MKQNNSSRQTQDGAILQIQQEGETFSRIKGLSLFRQPSLQISSRRTKRVQPNATNAPVASTLQRVSLSLSSSRTFSSRCAIEQGWWIQKFFTGRRRRDNYMPTSTPRVNWLSCTKLQHHNFSQSFFFPLSPLDASRSLSFSWNAPWFCSKLSAFSKESRFEKDPIKLFKNCFKNFLQILLRKM